MIFQLPSGFRTPLEGHPENRMHQALRSNLSSQPPLLLWELSKEMQMGWKWEGCSKTTILTLEMKESQVLRAMVE